MERITIMRNKNIKLQLWIDENEAQKLSAVSKKCNVTQSALIRYLINDFIPREAPPPEYYDIIHELRNIGNNMYQIYYRLESMGLIDAPMYKENAKHVTEVCDFLMSAFSPQKI